MAVWRPMSQNGVEIERLTLRNHPNIVLRVCCVMHSAQPLTQHLLHIGTANPCSETVPSKQVRSSSRIRGATLPRQQQMIDATFDKHHIAYTQASPGGGNEEDDEDEFHSSDETAPSDSGDEDSDDEDDAHELDDRPRKRGRTTSARLVRE